MEKIDKSRQIYIATERMKQMDIYTPYINEFKKSQTVTMFENFAGFYATSDNGFPEVENKIKSLSENGDLVYAVSHDYVYPEMEMYSFLIVSSNAEDECEIKLDFDGGKYFPFAYVWNVSDDMMSEYGYISVQSFGGGIRRFG